MSQKPKTQKVSKNRMSKNDLISQVTSNTGYTYIGNRFSKCGELRIDLDTMYLIQRMNTEAQAAKDLIVKMVGKKGIQFTKNKKIVENKRWERNITNLFKDPHTNSFKSFRDKYYTNSFCSGTVTCFFATMGDGSKRIQILDTRRVQKESDNFGNLKKIKYNGKELALDKIYSQITKYDPNSIIDGMSVYESIVFDAMSDHEASKRNYYFFKNNAMPSVILTMEDDIENPTEITEAIKRFEDKYKGSEKSHGVFASGGIKEVRTIDFTNKDLELLELKKFAIKKMGVIFGFDPRFLGYRDGENGSHSEYQIMAAQSDKSMLDFADVLEEFMFDVVKRIFPEFPYDSIQLVNDQFVDESTKQSLILTKLEKGAITVAQAIEELGYPTDKLPTYLDNYFLNIQWDTIPNIISKSKAATKAIEIKAKSEESENDDNIDEDGEKTEDDK